MDEDTIYLYLNGNCHLLSYFLSKTIPESQIFILDETVSSSGESTTQPIHSMVKISGIYYDILGPTEDIPSYIENWKKMYGYGEDYTYNLRPMRDISELRLNNYLNIDAIFAKRLIPFYLKTYKL
jgi:hypothetical protein